MGRRRGAGEGADEAGGAEKKRENSGVISARPTRPPTS